jgi:hypothetical protein
VVTVYQPQVDAWNGLRLEGQAAVSLRAGEGAPTFGVMWFAARTSVDKPARLVILEELTITRTSFPSAPDKAEALTARLRAQVGNAPKVIALDRLEAASVSCEPSARPCRCGTIRHGSSFPRFRPYSCTSTAHRSTVRSRRRASRGSSTRGPCS